MDCIIPAQSLVPTWTQILAWLVFLLKLNLVFLVLLVVRSVVGEVMARFAPHFGEYHESNVVDLQERRRQLGATAYRRAIR